MQKLLLRAPVVELSKCGPGQAFSPPSVVGKTRRHALRFLATQDGDGALRRLPMRVPQTVGEEADVLVLTHVAFEGPKRPAAVVSPAISKARRCNGHRKPGREDEDPACVALVARARQRLPGSVGVGLIPPDLASSTGEQI